MMRTSSGSRNMALKIPGKNMDRWSSHEGSCDSTTVGSSGNGSISSTPSSPGLPWKSRGTVKERRPSLDRIPSFRTGPETPESPYVKDVECISYLEKEAYFALRYLQDVVEKNTTELLAGSTTVVMENIYVLDSHIQSTLNPSFKDDSIIKAESREVYRYLAVLVNWSDQILLRRVEHNNQPMRRHNQIVPAIQALRKHIELLVGRYRKGALLLRPLTPPSSPMRSSLTKLPLSSSAESLTSPMQMGFPRCLPGSSGCAGGGPNGCDETDHAANSYASNGLSRMAQYSPSFTKTGFVPGSSDSGRGSFGFSPRQLAAFSSPRHNGSISSSVSSLQSRSPSPGPLTASPLMYRNPASDDSGISSGISSRQRPLDNLPPRPMGKNGSITSLSGKSDLTTVVSNLFPAPRGHKSYLRQASLGAEPIYYDNVPDRVPPLPPKKQRNVMSYVEVFAHDSAVGAQDSPPLPIRSQFLPQPELMVLPRKLSFDAAMRADRSESSVQATPELKRFFSERGASKEFSEEILQIFDNFGTGSETGTLVRNRQSPAKKLYKGQASLLSKVDCLGQLIYPRGSQGRGEIKGGPVDALIVEATKATKNDFAYQEAFITTYRTFISSEELVDKLLHRYRVFAQSEDQLEKSAARNTFTLLLRVVEELCLSEIFRTGLIDVLLNFVQKLLTDGELAIARGLRRKILDKHELDWKSRSSSVLLMLPTRRHRRVGYLLDFKSQDLAEQMTLMDADLLAKIELTELLSWTKEQCEDAGANLSAFTEHFNKVSFWARTRILEQTDQRDREKYFCKFMKIMRCLRKVQNFNSYLALLAAVDSAPVRRLSHSKTHLEALKDLSGLIDSSQSFRAYRSVLAQMEPPCIPYIGIALQDLTFVNENPDWLDPDKTLVNFGKRWQQYHILSHLSRFQKTSHYHFQRSESIRQFFNNFDSYLSEEALWQISESIRPRGSRT